MGALTSRQNGGVEEVDIPSNSVYRYPPKTGSYFASHFIMGGEKFESTHPEGYLFGENTDLNFLANRPVAFPYATPPPQEPVKTLRSLINIRKDTLRLVRCSEDAKLCAGGEEASKPLGSYNIEFTFDSDTQVAITIYYQAIEEYHNGVPIYLPQDSALQSETVHFKRGVCQQFSLPSHTLNLSEWAEEELLFDMDKDVYPMVVQATVDEGDDQMGHSHVLLATFEKHMDGSYCVKPLKQKQVVDGVSYLLQEIYGIENKYNSQESKVADDEISDNSAECVVCLSDVRDTLILPCRHLCLCNACADTLRYQANCCPICRLPFRALLQIRAMRKKLSPLSPAGYNSAVITSHTPDTSEEHSASEQHPPGYEAVSLLEALNGPLNPSRVGGGGPLGGGVPGAHVSGSLPSYGGDNRQALPALSCAPQDGSGTAGQALKLKKSSSKSLSQNSSVLPEEDEKSGSESEVQASQRKQEGVTPDSDNLTLSSSGAVDQSSCTGTPLSSTIASPEEPVSSSLAQSVMSMASSQSQQSQISTDTLSSMSGSYQAPHDPDMESRGPSQQDGEELPSDSKEQNMAAAAAEEQEQDSEGNDVTEDDCPSPSIDQGVRSEVLPSCGEVENNNQGPAAGSASLCSLTGLDNQPQPAPADAPFADLLYLDAFRNGLDTFQHHGNETFSRHGNHLFPHHASASNINLEERGVVMIPSPAPKSTPCTPRPSRSQHTHRHGPYAV
ncbi:E3 ubiquitin ligase RNF157 [Engraulis encrasicolus]|uniref:E3 ubiquitin ligase RNF157 n=1 Tax=Engraulis encrasicolus TaxID=184585 RepID=UPI002FCFC834